MPLVGGAVKIEQILCASSDMAVFGGVIDIFGESECRLKMIGDVINMFGDVIECGIALIEADGGQVGSFLKEGSTGFAGLERQHGFRKNQHTV